MTTIPAQSIALPDDAQLVAASLSGDRDAFGQIVARYQSLVCSLAYSATGSLAHSEDLAQETFLTAWKQLAGLREPAKLRSWLCSIARNLINNWLRRQGREPSHAAAPIEALHEAPAAAPAPAEQTISNEEQAILWRSLERIPEQYREPLVLFYREHQSVEAVAQKLELSEANVKQRLSRGRKLLAEEVAAFVEGALTRTNPGLGFTSAVVAALPALSLSTKAAMLGATAKGVGGVKALGLFGTLLAPLLGLFGNYASYRLSLDEARTEEERGRIKRLFRNAALIALAITAAAGGPLYRFCHEQDRPVMFWSLWLVAGLVAYFLTLVACMLGTLGGRRRHLRQVLERDHDGQFPPAAYEYRSRAALFGLPLVHVRIGDRFDVLRGPVTGWIAIGSSHAVGGLFASGGVAIAPFSIGGVAIGLVPFGAISLGLIPLGAIALGVWAYGGFAVGWQTFCGAGFAANAGMGGLIFAHDFAVGGIVQAAQANTDAAWQFIRHQWFFRCGQALSRYGLLLQLAWILPLVWQARIVARARQGRAQA